MKLNWDLCVPYSLPLLSFASKSYCLSMLFYFSLRTSGTLPLFACNGAMCCLMIEATKFISLTQIAEMRGSAKLVLSKEQ